MMDKPVRSTTCYIDFVTVCHRGCKCDGCPVAEQLKAKNPGQWPKKNSADSDKMQEK